LGAFGVTYVAVEDDGGVNVGGPMPAGAGEKDQAKMVVMMMVVIPMAVPMTGMVPMMMVVPVVMPMAMPAQQMPAGRGMSRSHQNAIRGGG